MAELLDETADWLGSELIFSPPYMNAAGSLGFYPDSRGPVDLSYLGAFVTNPISLARRAPAQNRCFQIYPGGFLMHTGHPNPGLKAAVRHFASHWKRSLLPIIIHLLLQASDDVAEMVQRLEGLEGVRGLEISLPPQVNREEASQIVTASLGELPIIVRLPLNQAVSLASIVVTAGAVAVSLAPPRGVLPIGGMPSDSSKTVRGRLFGPALYPLALATVTELVRKHVPVIGGCGVYSLDDADAMILSGARAVQIDASLWSGKFWRDK